MKRAAADMALDHDRARRHTAASVLARIDADTADRLRRYAADPAGIEGRRGRLDREVDTDRAIELEASLMGLAGLALGVLVRPAFLALPPRWARRC